MTALVGSVYTDEYSGGPVTAWNSFSGENITKKIAPVNLSGITKTPGRHVITYWVTGENGNSAHAERVVIVVTPTASKEVVKVSTPVATSNTPIVPQDRKYGLEIGTICSLDAGVNSVNAPGGFKFTPNGTTYWGCYGKFFFPQSSAGRFAVEGIVFPSQPGEDLSFHHSSFGGDGIGSVYVFSDYEPPVDILDMLSLFKKDPNVELRLHIGGGLGLTLSGKNDLAFGSYPLKFSGTGLLLAGKIGLDFKAGPFDLSGGCIIGSETQQVTFPDPGPGTVSTSSSARPYIGLGVDMFGLADLLKI